MIENTEKIVLMKCEVCGYKERVSLRSLETIKSLPSVSDVYKILYSFCLNDMYEDEDNNNKH